MSDKDLIAGRARIIEDRDVVKANIDARMVGVCIGSVLSLEGYRIFIIQQPNNKFFQGTARSLTIVKKYDSGYLEELIESTNAEGGKFTKVRLTRYPPTQSKK